MASRRPWVRIPSAPPILSFTNEPFSRTLQAAVCAQACAECGDLYLGREVVAKKVRERENEVGTISFRLVSKKVAAK
jgi:hypothetical protein